MPFLNLPWRWDSSEIGESVPVGLRIRRWRRGPVTFYRYAIDLEEDTMTQFWICIANNLSFGVHFPAWMGLGVARPPSVEDKP